MESVIKAFTGVFFTLLVTFVGISLISASVDTRNADAFVSDVVYDLEASNCSNTTIEKWKDNAKKENNSYNLTITTPVKNSATGRNEATVTLQYRYTIPMIGMAKDKQVTSIVR